MRLIAAAKNIRTEEINIHLKVKPEWYLAKINPYGQVPTIEHEGKLIRESAIAFGEYLLAIIFPDSQIRIFAVKKTK